MVDCNIFMNCFIERVYALYRLCCECCREDLWSLHASLFYVMQDLPETLESWQCLTWAVLITVMARILIKSLFAYPGALWSLSGALVCSSTAASLVCVAMASLTQTAVPPSHSHGRHDEWRRTCRWTAGATVRNRSIPQGRKTSMSNQRESGPRVMFFQALPPTPYEPAAPLHRTVHVAIPWPRLIPLSWCSWCIIPPVTCGEERRVQEINDVLKEFYKIFQTGQGY